jgi:hypothetical protein
VFVVARKRRKAKNWALAPTDKPAESNGLASPKRRPPQRRNYGGGVTANHFNKRNFFKIFFPKGKKKSKNMSFQKIKKPLQSNLANPHLKKTGTRNKHRHTEKTQATGKKHQKKICFERARATNTGTRNKHRHKRKTKAHAKTKNAIDVLKCFLVKHRKNIDSI